MRIVPIVLLGLLLLVQASLWMGRGSVPYLMTLRSELEAQKASNDAARVQTERLAAEVADLKDGLEMVEEKARFELGMVKPDETLVVISNNPAAASLAASAAAQAPLLAVPSAGSAPSIGAVAAH